MNITEIENLTVAEMEKFKKEGKAEKLNIKDHDCYFVDIEGNFGYSVLVFKNNRHIYYANDYQLHHRSKSKTELKDFYIETLNNKLFTEAELMEEIKDYNEYSNKGYYVRNYWIMQFEHVSAFYIGKPSEEQAKAMRNMVYCPPCFNYVKDPEIVKKAYRFIGHIEKSYKEASESIEVFKKMISYELANHEACITGDYTETLNSLGLNFESLTGTQQEVIKKELNRQIENYC